MHAPLFIVAAPRSYTSLVGGMLGQHPQAYGLPEVNLCQGGKEHGGFLAERPRPPALGTAGLLRVLAQLHEGEQTEEAVLRAQDWIDTHSDLTGAQVFGYIQELVGHDRMLVDKSPQNAVVGAKIGNTIWGNLPRLLEMFPTANFLNLVRHPRAMSRSSLSIREKHGARGTMSREMAGDARGFSPDAVWLRAQQNIEEFFQLLPPGQFARIRGEDLLRNPRLYLRQICEWLGLDTDDASIDAMMHPERSPYACVGPPSAKHGADPNFLMNPKLDMKRLASIQEASLEGELEWMPGTFSPEIVHMARKYGYE